MAVTSPVEDAGNNASVGGNYYMTVLAEDDSLQVCFTLCAESRLFCFRIKGMVNVRMLSSLGWINNIINGDIELVIPPRRNAFLIKSNRLGALEISAYSRIFWNIEHEVLSMKTPWSSIPVYYSKLGKSFPSLAFLEMGDWIIVAIGDSPERAVLSAVHLKRVGLHSLVKETKEFLSRFSSMNKRVRDNALLSIFLSNSICVDQEQDCILASKSPMYYVSGGYWSRDFIFWVFPVIKRFDPQRASELIRALLNKYWNNRGIHALYLDGRVLYDGFELDQLALHFLIIKQAIELDLIVKEEGKLLVEDTLAILAKYKNETHDIYSTELNSSDDPVLYPYVTYDNVLLWYSLKELSKAELGVLKKEIAELSDRIRKDVMKYMIYDGRFCYSTDLNGNYEMYDDPTGSFYLFPFLGFVDKDDSTFKNTIKWINSRENKFLIDGKFSGEGNRHVNHPWVHWYVSKVLSGYEDIEFLYRMEMDHGLGCETVDENTGRCRTGVHFPGASGFIVQGFYAQNNKQR